MLKFHVDLHTVNPVDGHLDIKFHTIVDADDAESAKKRAMAVMAKEKPELDPPDSWEWSVYEVPRGGG